MTPLHRHLTRGGVALAVLVALFGAWSGLRVWKAWSGVERVEFDAEGARVGVEAPDNTLRLEPGDVVIDVTPEVDEDPAPADLPVLTPEDIPTTVTTTPRIARDVLETFLIIGSDFRPEWGGTRADVILLVMLLPGDDPPIMVSLPRDLYIPNPCYGGYSRINANLLGCGSAATGPELLSIAVEDFTGVPVDHFAVLDFEGFERIVDTVGGVEVCVDEPIRTDWRAGTPVAEFEPGCTTAGGADTLKYIRSRKTEHLVNGRWGLLPGVNDLTRNQRQQELLLQAIGRLKDYVSITEFATVVESVADAFTLDEGLGLRKAISIAWDLRSFDPDTVIRPTLSVRDYVTESGAFVLLPTRTFQEVLFEAYDNAAALYSSAASSEE